MIWKIKTKEKKIIIYTDTLDITIDEVGEVVLYDMIVTVVSKQFDLSIKFDNEKEAEKFYKATKKMYSV